MSKIQKNPQAIAADSVIFSLKGFIPQQKKGFRKISADINLKYRGYGHDLFSNVAEIFYKGEKIGKLDLFPHSLLDPDRVMLSVDNKLLYSKGWTTKVRKICSELNLSFLFINKIDVCVDQKYDKQFDFIHKWAKGTIQSVGNTVVNVRYQGNRKGVPKITYFTFGSRASDKFLRAYYKRQELQVSNKQYIEEWWHHNGFKLSDTDEVARFEMSIKRKELKKYKDLGNQFGDITLNNLQHLESFQYLSALFNTAKEGFFEFVSRRSLLRTGNISRCARKVFLDLSEISSYLLHKITSKATTAIFSAKITARMLYMIHCKTGEQQYMKQIEEILYNFNLSRWFYANVQRFYKEFALKFRNDKEFEYIRNYTGQPEFIQARLYNLNNY